MGLRAAIALIGNFVVVAGLITVGFRLFAQYHSSGKWAKNITGLLAGMGLLVLALGLLITPRNAQAVLVISRTNAHIVFLVGSSALLVAAIAAYGLITYWKPLRLQLQQKLEKDLTSELPRIP